MDETTAREFLALLLVPDACVEVRMPQTKRGTVTGYFDDVDQLLGAVRRWDGNAAGIYVTCNPCNPDLLARAANRLREFTPGGEAAQDRDILCRRWLYLDFDPERPKGTSATEAELAAALQVRDEVISWLTASGWPQPLIAMSGNGGHLLYQLPDLPNDEATARLLRSVTAVISKRFTTDAVDVDQNVTNAARHCKVYGTWTRKGDEWGERVHRRSAWTALPTGTVSVAQLRDIAQLGLTETEAPLRGVAPAQSDYVLTNALDHAGVTYRAGQHDAQGRQWYNLERCPFHPESKSQYQCGVAQDGAGKLYGKCQHFDQKGWQDFKSALNLGRYKTTLERLAQYKPATTHEYEPAEALAELELKLEEAECAVEMRDRAPLLDEAVALYCDLSTRDQSLMSETICDRFGIGKREFNKLVKEATAARRETLPPYAVENHRVLTSLGANGDQRMIPISNFVALITRHIHLDDGQNEPNLEYEIEGYHQSGARFPNLRVRAKEFPGMKWIAQWGAQANIFAGNHNDDKLRDAIQRFSGDVPWHRIYTAPGWEEINGQRVFLSQGGVVNGAGLQIEVDIPDTDLQHYYVPPQPDDEVTALREALQLLHMGEFHFTIPVFAAAFLAPLRPFIKPDFMLWVYGQTGLFKSWGTAVFQCFFGPNWSGDTLPISWRDRRFKLEQRLFMARDVLAIVDNYAPGGDPHYEKRLANTSMEIIHAIGDQKQPGRGMWPPDRKAPIFPPRCMSVTTAEKPPTGDSESEIGRLVIIPLVPGDIDLEKMDAAQDNAKDGIYAAAMSGYLHWIIQNWDDLDRKLAPRWQHFRDQFEVNGHRRMPANFGKLYAAFQTALEYAKDIGAITAVEMQNWLTTAHATFISMAEVQKQVGEHVRPLDMFCIALNEMIDAGVVFLPPRDGEGSGLGAAHGEKVGYYDRAAPSILLIPGAALRQVRRHLQEQGNNFNWSVKDIGERMINRGFFEGRTVQRGDGSIQQLNSVARLVNDRAKSFWELPLAAFRAVVGEEA